MMWEKGVIIENKQNQFGMCIEPLKKKTKHVEQNSVKNIIQ